MENGWQVFKDLNVRGKKKDKKLLWKFYKPTDKNL